MSLQKQTVCQFGHNNWYVSPQGKRACNTCRSIRGSIYGKTGQRKMSLRKFRETLRSDVIAAYGGKCSCCEEINKEFLCIDHINGGGNKSTEKIGGVYMFYAFLRRSGFPKDQYRILCWNCNSSRGLYGYCPHEKERVSNDQAATMPILEQ